MKLSSLLFLLSCSLGFIACGSRYVLKDSKDIAATGWTYADSLQSDMFIGDTSGTYDIQLMVKHSSDYPYQNLYIRIHTIFPDGKRLSQPLSLELADKSGRWYGKGGAKRTLILPIQQNAYFDKGGAYRFVIEQFMRVDTLEGLQSIGIQVARKGER